MVSKKEVQEKILELRAPKATEEEFNQVLKSISPGTHLRSALEGALKVGKGALIVVENPSLFPLIDGGFRVNTRFTPQKIIELCKMDGAIILSKDLKRITYANTMLAPDNSIKTNETGTRHKSAERTAKQIGTLVIAISERRKEITLFYKNKRHVLIETSNLLRKVNQHLQLLEKQRELFDKHIDLLNRFELTNYPGLKRAVQVIKKGYQIQKIAHDLKPEIVELGKEGLLIKARLKELLLGVEKETTLVLKDYTSTDLKKSKNILSSLSYEELLDNEKILSALDYEESVRVEPIKGWRILSKTTLPDKEVALLVKKTGTLGKALYSGIKVYEDLVGKERAHDLKEEIDRMKLNH